MAQTRLPLGLIFTFWTVLSSTGYAQFPPEEGVPLMPRVLPGPVMPPFVPPPIPPHRPRLDSREVWQYYGVTQNGEFRPRMILSPTGTHNYATGEPYPWITNNTQLYMPYVLD